MKAEGKDSEMLRGSPLGGEGGRIGFDPYVGVS